MTVRRSVHASVLASPVFASESDLNAGVFKPSGGCAAAVISPMVCTIPSECQVRSE